MSLKRLVTLLNDSSEGTPIRDIYYTHQYDKIDDVEKTQSPFIWADITSNNTEFVDSGSMWDSWSLNLKLFLGEASGKSKRQLDKDEELNIEYELDQIRSKFQYNLREIAEVNSIDISTNTNFPMYNNGAIVWVLDFTVQIMNENDICNDC